MQASGLYAELEETLILAMYPHERDPLCPQSHIEETKAPLCIEMSMTDTSEIPSADSPLSEL